MFGSMCQCPVSGYPHFYVGSIIAAQAYPGVSMPCLGLSPFLRQKGNHYGYKAGCVNALSRAIPISTGGFEYERSVK